MATKSYVDLKNEVWDKGLCAGCGACVAVCPADAICFDEPGGALKPRNIGYCKQLNDEVDCGACYDACPRTSQVNEGILGKYQEIISARATLDIPRRQTGGAVTAILLTALQQGLIDAVVTVAEDRWTLKPVSVVITGSEELVQHAGSRYNWWVPLVAALKTAVIEKKCQKIAVIGVPCVVQAIYHIRQSDNDLLQPFGKRIRLVIGLFCTENFDYRVLMEGLLQKKHHIDTWNIDHLDVRGRLEVTMRDGSSRTLPLPELLEAVRPGCHYCTDFTALFSDISAGAVGSERGYTTLIVRNEIGKMFFNEAINQKNLVSEGSVNIEAIERLGRIKIEKAH
ncbi:MAG: Coenzyme F420 hydrogenase/dehydrogenase, beta subunit C-terminal domain [Methanolinea sp.]|jgi:coenzyme F420 hydrogenase subunit beta|nr:Coenzyme F420 hydrogenase/dehydrogenase, beta subunit C-terminal domain [Methanolinea sp.]